MEPREIDKVFKRSFVVGCAAGLTVYLTYLVGCLDGYNMAKKTSVSDNPSGSDTEDSAPGVPAE